MRQLILALALASPLPCGALVWPDAVPREVVVLALTAWVGIFVVALRSARAEERRRRGDRDEAAPVRRSFPPG